MERLTVDTNILFCDIAQCRELPGGTFCKDGYCDQRRVYERLREYERLTAHEEKESATEDVSNGLELVEVYSILRRLRKYEALGTIDDLATLAKARDEGRVVVLPCKGQTMHDDLISRSALLQWFEPFKAIENAGIPQLIEAINVQPAIDATPVVHGQWLEDGDAQTCSNCGEEHEWGDYRASYCDACGAKMEEGSDHAD